MKKITLEALQKKKTCPDYLTFYEEIRKQISAGRIKPVLASKTNGKTPALYNSYWLLEDAPDYSGYEEELNYQTQPEIGVDYYLKHLDIYEKERRWVRLLNEFLRTKRVLLKHSESINERSFEIWQREKFLRNEQGKTILKHCGITLDSLHIYETCEPLSCFTYSRQVPQNILILENKDTFYSMRKYMLSESRGILGREFQTLIYGAGKGILKSFQDFKVSAEPYLQAAENLLHTSERKLKEMDLEKRRLQQEEEGLQKEYTRLTQGKVLELAPEFEAMLEELGLHYLYGMEWMKKNNLSEQENQALVRANPFLPYALILSRADPQKTGTDYKERGRIPGLFFQTGDYPQSGGYKRILSRPDTENRRNESSYKRTGIGNRSSDKSKKRSGGSDGASKERNPGGRRADQVL